MTLFPFIPPRLRPFAASRFVAALLPLPAAASAPADRPLADFLGPPSLTQTRLFSSQRFPTVTLPAALLAEPKLFLRVLATEP